MDLSLTSQWRHNERIKFHIVNVSRLVLQLSLRNQLKLGAKSTMEMEQRRQAIISMINKYISPTKVRLISGIDGIFLYTLSSSSLKIYSTVLHLAVTCYQWISYEIKGVRLLRRQPLSRNIISSPPSGCSTGDSCWVRYDIIYGYAMCSTTVIEKNFSLMGTSLHYDILDFFRKSSNLYFVGCFR